MAKNIARILGPLLAILIILFLDLDPENKKVTLTAAIAVWMAVWWITEAISIAATALLPIVLFPLLGVVPGREISGMYFNHIIFLFIGGFIVALALQRWGLHKRIALKIIMLVGTGSSRIILGFMIASFFLSMWVSNTATVMMMLPIALAVIGKLEDNFDKESAGKIGTRSASGDGLCLLGGRYGNPDRHTAQSGFYKNIRGNLSKCAGDIVCRMDGFRFADFNPVFIPDLDSDELAGQIGQDRYAGGEGLFY